MIYRYGYSCFQSISLWLNSIIQISPFFFSFNLQSDLSSTRPIEKEAIDNLCKENGFLGWTEMSVKEDVNVSETME